MRFNYDVIVVGGGHAGCEATHAAASLGSSTLLITMDMHTIAQMSCNPAMGGIAKGQIVREIDALGGKSAIVTDKNAIQFRMLNRSKGPAMWSPRSQIDRQKYSEAWRNILENTTNVHIWQDTAKKIIIENKRVVGIETTLKVKFYAKTVILTTGTFLNGLIHIGKTQLKGGRISEPACEGISNQLRDLGHSIGRMKTGTPVRIDGRSVNFSLLTEQKGENDFHKFSYLDIIPRTLPQLSCWSLYTNPEVHEVLQSSIEDSPLYNGQIKSIGPRYCPSIETKIVTFADKTQHQLFLEPEGIDTNEYYLNGFSSSLPIETQIKALKKIEAFKNIQIYRPGYAIEYDYSDPTQLSHTLESKIIKNLFLAGQINGTTGYEEAAGQGLIAGINAHINVHGGHPFILKRNEAYIGVLIDDLVTKGVDEPYRMFTSRAEYRILLRQDDADMRLTEKAYEIGLATEERVKLLKIKKENIAKILAYIENNTVKPEIINSKLEVLNTTPIKQKTTIKSLLTRPQINFQNIKEDLPELNTLLNSLPTNRKEEIIEETEIVVKYQGYIEREKQIAEKIKRLENIFLKNNIDYNQIQSLSTEARQKLNTIKPSTIGQASRIPGVSPNDINVLLVLHGR